MTQPTPPSAAALTERFGKPDTFTEGPERNRARANSGQVALEGYAETDALANNEDREMFAGDMIANLLHYTTMHGGDAEQAYTSGWIHFALEVGHGYENPATQPLRRWRLTGNYGTFVIERTVEAADEDAAFEQTGISTTLIAAGWTMVDPPEGEEWEITELTD